MKQFSVETRRRMSESAKRRAATPEFLEQVRGYWTPVCTETELRQMYCEEGMSQHEIKDVLGVTLKRVQTSMRRYGIVSRKAIKRNQYGEKNSSWRGSDATYQGFHARLYHLKGHPQYCETCRTTNPAKSYDWANMTGRYDDPDDYKRLCRSCHFKYDNLRRRLEGGGSNA
jgi:hypothetical protein